MSKAKNTLKQMFLATGILFFFSFSVGAAPTIEGLLRGGENPDNLFDWSVIRIKIEREIQTPSETLGLSNSEQTTEESETESTQSGEENSEMEKVKTVSKHLKLIFSNDSEKPIHFIQVEYSSLSMKKSEIVDVKSSRNLLETLKLDSRQERSLFYGLLVAMSTGNSSVISDLLTKYNPDYRPNNQLLDPEKVTMYEKYKNYLAAIKDDPKLETEMESPLRPTDVEALSKVRQALKKPMYRDLEQVGLVHEGERFFWKVVLQNFVGEFTIDKHRLRSLELTTPQGVLGLGASRYQVFSSNFYLPGLLKIKDVLDQNYMIHVRRYQQFGNPSTTFDSLLKKYERKGPMAIDKSSDKTRTITVKDESSENEALLEDGQVSEKTAEFNLLL